MQAWREPKTCADCRELAHMVNVDQFGQISAWWQCLQDWRSVGKEDEACPLFTRRGERPPGRT